MSNLISATINCDHYKIGIHGWVFVERDGEWLRSNNFTAAEVLQHHNEEYRRKKETEQKEKERQARRAKK